MLLLLLAKLHKSLALAAAGAAPGDAGIGPGRSAPEAGSRPSGGVAERASGLMSNRRCLR
jgi:hypothetical protein